MHQLWNKIFQPTSIAPLITFRVLFGAMMFFSTLRFWLNGWIEENYINPNFHFKFYGFSWVTVPSPTLLYAIFIVTAFAALAISLGFLYRWACVTFFLLFTYIELIDATFYLNHYYFVSLVSFLLIFLPANRNRSLDVYLGLTKRKTHVFNWHIWSIMLMLSIVYFYAGIAKLNYHWLIEAQPLKIWLAAHTHLPLIGSFMDDNWLAYAFSWGGAIFDLSIPFLLLIKKTRRIAYLLVIFFHGFTSWLFPIGIFPFVMILSTTIFFSIELHERIWKIARNKDEQQITIGKSVRVIVRSFLIVFFGFQLIFPFRHLLYPNNLFWTEQGYRFSWRVMLMEKAGYAQFKVYPKNDNQYIIINNADYLTPIQEKMMATQPDFILQYAHYLSSLYKSTKNPSPKVTAFSFVSLNGKGSQRYVKEDVNLTEIENSLKPIDWLEKY